MAKYRTLTIATSEKETLEIISLIDESVILTLEVDEVKRMTKKQERDFIAKSFKEAELDENPKLYEIGKVVRDEITYEIESEKVDTLFREHGWIKTKDNANRPERVGE